MRVLQMKVTLGSPPPMRGKVILVCNLMLVFRITPAYAGKSSICTSDVLGKPDHPRLCGEKFRLPHPSEMRLGSPPPMRGKEDSLAILSPVNGITPAYAGKRQARVHYQNLKRDHPRLCGEKSYRFDCSNPTSGSPPPMRGKAKLRLLLVLLHKDHPRLCGEK